MTLEEIGEVLGGITRQAVEQILRRALEKTHRAFLRDERPPVRLPADRQINPYGGEVAAGGAINPYGNEIDPYKTEGW